MDSSHPYVAVMSLNSSVKTFAAVLAASAAVLFINLMPAQVGGQAASGPSTTVVPGGTPWD